MHLCSRYFLYCWQPPHLQHHQIPNENPPETSCFFLLVLFVSQYVLLISFAFLLFPVLVLGEGEVERKGDLPWRGDGEVLSLGMAWRKGKEFTLVAALWMPERIMETIWLRQMLSLEP